jgi:hypothetical protein
MNSFEQQFNNTFDLPDTLLALTMKWHLIEEHEFSAWLDRVPTHIKSLNLSISDRVWARSVLGDCWSSEQWNQWFDARPNLVKFKVNSLIVPLKALKKIKNLRTVEFAVSSVMAKRT